MDSFFFQGSEYQYFRHPANNTGINERIVEVPIAARLVQENRGRLLEVGNVLGQYIGRRWTTVDLVEKEKGVINCDILDFKGGPFDLIVSVSTFEHIGVDFGKDPSRAMDAVLHCQDLLAPGGKLAFTVPMGYHPLLDGWLMARWGGKRSYLKRISEDNRWSHVEQTAVTKAQYGKPFKYGNALIFGEFVKERS